MVYPIGAVSGYSGSNKLTIQRMSGGSENGSVVVTAENMQGRDLGFLGEVTGTVSVVLGSTDGGLGTEHKVFNASGARIDLNDASQNISFNNSTAMQINVVDNRNEANLQFNNVSNSTLDATGTARALGLTTTAGSNNNFFNFGWGDVQIVDGGSYNTTSLGSGTAYYASTQTSKGAVVFGGSGNATYQIAGSLGVFQQGTGLANYQINSPTEDENSGYKNAIFSSSVSNIVDQGRHSLIVSSNSGSTLVENGFRSIGILGSLSKVVQGKNDQESYLFANGRTDINAVDADGKPISGVTINLMDRLYKAGWSNTHYNSAGQLESSDYYFGGYTSFHGSSRTGDFLREYSALTDILAMGDEGAEANKSRVRPRA